MEISQVGGCEATQDRLDERQETGIDQEDLIAVVSKAGQAGESRLMSKLSDMMDRIDAMGEAMNSSIEDRLAEMMEDSVVPIFESYIVKMFEKSSKVFEEGVKFYGKKLQEEEEKIEVIGSKVKGMFEGILDTVKNMGFCVQELGGVICTDCQKKKHERQSDEIAKKLEAFDVEIGKLKSRHKNVVDVLENLCNRQHHCTEKKLDRNSKSYFAPETDKIEPKPAPKIEASQGTSNIKPTNKLNVQDLPFEKPFISTQQINQQPKQKLLEQPTIESPQKRPDQRTADPIKQPPKDSSQKAAGDKNNIESSQSKPLSIDELESMLLSISLEKKASKPKA